MVQQELAKERDDARAEVAKMKTERNEAKVDAELRKALDAAGILPEFVDDAMLRAKAAGFVVNDKGQVVTKPDAKDTIPNASPAAWVQGELKAKAPRFWPTSLGGGAKTLGYAAHGGIDVTPFCGGGTLTEMYAVVARVGEKAVLDSLRRSGITPPPWLKGGGR